MLNYLGQREVASFCVYKALCFEKNGGEEGDSMEIGASPGPVGMVYQENCTDDHLKGPRVHKRVNETY
jgi:hypothetical protein